LRERVERAGRDVAWAEFVEQDGARGDGALASLLAVDELGHLDRQLRLRLAAARVLVMRLEQGLDLILRQQREQLEVALRVAVVGIHPELVQLVRRGEAGIEPDRPGFRLSELRARRRREERSDE